MARGLELVVVIFSFLGFAQCGSWCTTDYNSFTFTYTYEYCKNDCCGSWPNEYCCVVFPTWGIAVIVVGAIILISCVVTCICCCVKQSGNRGRVIQPQPQQGLTVFTTQAGVQPLQQPYGQQPQPAPGPGNQPPPMYGNQAAPPYTLPGHSSAYPAYPPPAAQKE